MQRATNSMNRLLALGAVVILAATTTPLVSGFGTGSGDRPVMPHGCPPAC
jgi:hypothetical protein